jgi:D-sedoheptulose 7-phosphate isomerase
LAAGREVVRERIVTLFGEHQRAAEAFLQRETGSLEAAVRLLAEAFRAGRRVFFFGNGGSAADAQHLAAEFVNRFLRERPALPALALTTDTSVLTSIANDRAYDEVFTRQLEALAAEGDVAVALSTSGRSPSVVRGVEAARKLGLRTLVFTGARGEALARAADVGLVVPSESTPRIQEMHMLAGHVLCEMVEAVLFEDRGPARS